jgi:hypothetical protein
MLNEHGKGNCLECPKCGLETLDVYYEEEGDVELGAVCRGCGLKGFYMNGKLIQLAHA